MKRTLLAIVVSTLVAASAHAQPGGWGPGMMDGPGPGWGGMMDGYGRRHGMMDGYGREPGWHGMMGPQTGFGLDYWSLKLSDEQRDKILAIERVGVEQALGADGQDARAGYAHARELRHRQARRRSPAQELPGDERGAQGDVRDLAAGSQGQPCSPDPGAARAGGPRLGPPMSTRSAMLHAQSYQELTQAVSAGLGTLRADAPAM